MWKIEKISMRILLKNDMTAQLSNKTEKKEA
ncbi:MAG: hypothetical protein MRECE_38c016 [Mycoplasmataceae bacterium CE_OT135]|nr:MAG: hypothetical protein MRECE_38c016 [Mycoplasmataceae bacterium CE_OT135]